MADIRLLIVDDHPVVRDGLRGMFTGEPGFEVLGEAANGAEALVLAGTLRPDVVLMDLRMPELDGVAAIARLAEVAPQVRVLVLTTYDTDSDVLPAIEAGATGRGVCRGRQYPLDCVHCRFGIADGQRQSSAHDVKLSRVVTGLSGPFDDD